MSRPRSHPAASPSQLPEEALAATREAAFLRLLGLLFERPRPGWADEVLGLAAECPDERLREIARTASTLGEGGYLAVFGPGGTVSPREAAYGRFVDPGRVMADLAGLYQAFAFAPHREDPIDHIAVEIGFAGYLALKEAFAFSIGDEARAELARRTRSHFLETHLRGFAAALGARLKGTPESHLEAAAVLLTEWAGSPVAESAADNPSAATVAGACHALLDGDEEVLDCGSCGTRELPEL